jgi:tetratricopeptide (TPR) repeat protein
VYVRALALAKLGRAEESVGCLQELLDFATKLSTEPYKPDYFHPQSPSVTFEDDPQTPTRIYGAYLAGLAHLGLGQPEEAKEAFEKTLALDPSHTGAWVEWNALNEEELS